VRPRRNLVAVLIYFGRILFSGWHEAIFDSPFGPCGTLRENFWEEICTSSRSSRTATTLMNSLSWHRTTTIALYSSASESLYTPQRIHGHGPSPLSKPTDDQHIARQRIRDGSPGTASETQVKKKMLQYASRAGPINFSWPISYVHCPQPTMTATVIF
jgi:hypothetical protein